MFSFFKRKGKAEPETAEPPRGHPTDNTIKLTPVDPRAPHELTKTSKDVVNLLIPETDYHQKTGVGAILEIMARKRRKPKRKARSESCRVSPPKTNLQRTSSLCDARAPDAKNNARVADESTEYAKPLVPQNKPEKHVSLVYVNESQERNAEALLRQIARTIDTAVDEINETKQMGGADSKLKDKYENAAIDCYKNELKGELEKLLKDDVEEDAESASIVKKSNLKPPRSDTEGCSDDDRSDCGKKKVTFRKHIIFDDGEQQTDEEVDSSFESLTSGEEEEYLEDIPESDNKTVIDVKNNEPITIKITPEDGLKRVYSDNSDSGFVDDKNCADDITSEVKSLVSESETEEEIVEEVEEIEEEVEEIEEEVEVEEIEEEVEEEIEEEEQGEDEEKTLVSQESKFQSQVAALAELADSRGGEADRARELIAAYRKQIEAKDQEIEQLKCELAAAYKESELVRQRSRSLEEELTAARGCSAELADQLQRRNDESLRQIRAELEDAQSQRAELESRVLALEQDKTRLEQEKVLQEQKAQEALAAAEANTAKWRLAHEAARSQAAARAERMLADCEWKMRELEKKARDAEKQKKELAETVEQLMEAPKPTPSHVAELQQLRGLATEQQRSVQALTLQLQRVETREEALKLEVHRLKELLERETVSGKEKEERHQKVLKQLEEQHSKKIESMKAEAAGAAAEAAAAAASTRAALERAHAERTRAALAQLRAEADHEAKNADRKLREVTTRFENLKEVLASKEAQFEHAIAEAHSKADWDILQLRHLLDKADITYANNIEQLTERFEKEKETLIEEWSQKLKEVEEEAAIAADEAKKLLESTRAKLVAERVDQINKLKEKHRQEMDDQWEQFMTDKENCLARMKTECRQEGEEERVKREKELLEEIAELKSQVQSKSLDFDNLAVKAAACGRTLAVTEQELREALAREKELREKRAEDASKLKQAEKASKEQVEHLTRKCACLRKLFDDMRGRLSARERAAEQEARAKDKELHQLRGEVARLTKILVEQSAPSLGARTRADGCETLPPEELAPKSEPPRRKGGSLRTPELSRKRPTLPELTGLPAQPRLTPVEFENGRRRAKSVDLPAVQVPVRIKQLEERSKE